jgi:hypothetical protein
MQTLKIGNTTYKLKDDRDIGPILAAAKKKPSKTRQKPDVRRFPLFIPGQTSTAHYVRMYYEANHATPDNMTTPEYVGALFGELSTTPAPYYENGDHVEAIVEGEPCLLA